MHTSRYLHNVFTAGRRRSVRLAAVGKIPPPPLRQPPPSSTPASASPKTTSAPSAAPLSSSASRPSSVTAASVSPEKAYERALAADHAIAAQQSTLAAMQRQQLFLERRIAEVEDMAVALQGQVTEARRAAGEVALQQQNVEMLVAQMEQRVLAMTATTTAAAAAAAATTSAPSAASGNTSSARGVEAAKGSAAVKEERRERETGGAEEDEEGEEEEEEVEIAFSDELRAEVLQMIDEALARHTPPVLAATATGKPPTHARDTSQPSSDGAATTTTTTTDAPLVQRLTELDQRLSTLQAQVAQLTLYRIDLTHAAQLATAQATPTAASPAPSLSEAAARLAETLRLCGAITFTDPAGATRVASQVVALRHVPVNMGAAEVRELCVRAAGAGCVVACVVKRVPVHRASRATVERGRQLPRGKDGGGSAAHEVASREDSERVFHVTFDTAEQAVRAVKALHGLRLKTASNDGVGGNPTRPTGSGGGTAAPALVVEPVVSSDIEAALRAMEAQTSPPTST